MTTKEQYDAAFEAERAKEYPAIDVFLETGPKLSRERLEGAARVLACPVKRNPPNWQHGRIVFALACNTLKRLPDQAVLMLDIGTAKGFSALCMQWAIVKTRGARPKPDAQVVSVDVIDPAARISRNTVAEVDGLKTLWETLEPWPESRDIHFLQSTGIDWLSQNRRRIHFAFVDGKHNHDQVSVEARMLSQRQVPGDMILFDDVHIPGVRDAVRDLKGYGKRFITILENRAYAVAEKE